MQTAQRERIRGIAVDGREIARLREQKNWTQEELAEKTGLSARLIQRVETDPRPIEPNNMLKIAHVLGVYPVQILPSPPEAMPPSKSAPPGFTTVRITIDFPTERYNEFKDGRYGKKLFAILGYLGLIVNAALRIEERKGSIIVTADVSREDAQRLIAARDAGDLRYFDITGVEIVKPRSSGWLLGLLCVLGILIVVVGFPINPWLACSAGPALPLLGLVLAFTRKAKYTLWLLVVMAGVILGWFSSRAAVAFFSGKAAETRPPSTESSTRPPEEQKATEKAEPVKIPQPDTDGKLPDPRGRVLKVLLEGQAAFEVKDGTKTMLKGEHGGPGISLACWYDQPNKTLTLVVANQKLPTGGFNIHQLDASRIVSATYYGMDKEGKVREGVDVLKRDGAVIHQGEGAARKTLFWADSAKWPDGGQWRIVLKNPD